MNEYFDMIKDFDNKKQDDMDDFFKSSTVSNICNECHKGNMLLMENESVNICNNCGYQKFELYIKHTDTEPFKEIHTDYICYKKLTHFKEIISQFQGLRQEFKFPPKLIELLNHSEFKTYEDLRIILKDNKYSKLYEMIPTLLNKYNIKQPLFTFDENEKICNLFNQLVSVYVKVVSSERNNFLNYTYVLYKILQILNMKHYLCYFPKFKNNQKMQENEYLFLKMCKYLNIEFQYL